MVDTIRQVERRTDDLASPSGTQRYRAVAELQLLVGQLAQQVTDLANTIVPGLIDDRVANPGNINPGNINASGSLTAQGFVTLPGILNHTNNNFRTATVGDNGEVGISSSSARYKQDIEDFELTEAEFLSIKARRFRYKSDVEARGDDATADVGFIAEELVGAGITEPVFYDPDGRPEGINYDRMTPHLWAMVTQLLERVAALENGE
jgi:hypothetical protein